MVTASAWFVARGCGYRWVIRGYGNCGRLKGSGCESDLVMTASPWCVVSGDGVCD